MITTHRSDGIKPDTFYDVSWDGVESPEPIQGPRAIAEFMLRGMAEESDSEMFWPNPALRQKELDLVDEEVRKAWQDFSRLSHEREVLRTAMGGEATLSEPLIVSEIDRVRAERNALLSAQRVAILELEIDGFFLDVARRFLEGRADLDGPSRLPEEHVDHFSGVPEEICNLADLVIQYCYWRNHPMQKHVAQRFTITEHSN